MGSEGNPPPVPGSKAMSPFDVEEFRQYAHRMVDFVADYRRDIESFPVRSEVEPGYLKPLLPDSAPEDPENLDDVLADVQSKIIPGITHWQSPNFYAYYPGNNSTASYLGDMLSGGLGVIGFSWIASPAATELETIVLDWLGKLLQLPNEFLSAGNGGGVIQGTASEAVLTVMIAARKCFVDKLTGQGLSEAAALSKLVTYTTDQSHSSVQKACQIQRGCWSSRGQQSRENAWLSTTYGTYPADLSMAGVDRCICIIAGVSGNLRVLPADSSTNFSLSPAVLSKTVAEDVAHGLVPFFLFATVGTTSSAAVDPISELGNTAIEHGMWFHVDAAYAGNACICPEFRHILDGIEKADSFSMNPHKWLLTSFDCSTLWVKDSKALVSALSTSPEYLRNKATDEQKVVDYKDWQIPLGRRFRSLKLWFVLRMYGASGLRNYIRSHIALAKHFASLVQANPKFEIVAPPSFSLVCFRLKPHPEDGDNGKTLNNNLMNAINSTGKLFFTHTILSGVFTLRMAIGASTTQLRHVDDAWTVIKAEADRLLGLGAREATSTE